jgi:hypothetical protein
MAVENAPDQVVLELDERAAKPAPAPDTPLAKYVSCLSTPRYARALALFWFLAAAVGFFGMSRVFPALVLKVRIV